MLGGNFPAGGNEGRRGGKKHLRPFRNGLLHHRLGVFPRLHLVIGADVDLTGQSLLQVLSALVVCAGPVAVYWVALVNEGDVQMIGPNGA